MRCEVLDSVDLVALQQQGEQALQIEPAVRGALQCPEVQIESIDVDVGAHDREITGGAPEKLKPPCGGFAPWTEAQGGYRALRPRTDCPGTRSQRQPLFAVPE